MKRRAWIFVAGIAGVAIAADPAYCCSSADLIQKQKAFSDAVKTAFDRDPGGDGARQAKVKVIVDRYNGLKNSTNGGYIIDMMCKEKDELQAIYK